MVHLSEDADDEKLTSSSSMVGLVSSSHPMLARFFSPERNMNSNSDKH